MGSEAMVRMPAAQDASSEIASSAGAVVPVYWIYADRDGRWCLRKEGGSAEAAFDTRAAAIAFLRDLIRNAPTYRLFVESADGGTMEEFHSPVEPTPGITATGRGPRDHSNEDDNVAEFGKHAGEVDAANASSEELAGTHGSGLRQRLEWADRLASAARIAPTRVGLLKTWLHQTKS